MHKYLLTLSLLCSNFLLSQSSPYQCAEIKSPAERLACYDNLFARPDKQINIKKPIIKPNNNPSTEKEKRLSFDQINKLKSGKQKDKSNEGTFGLSYKQLKESRAIPDEEEKKIISSITKATKQLTKKVVFRLENGHIWQSESPLPSSKIGQFKKGTNIELEVSRMGAFWMINKSNNIRIKVTRIK